MDGLKVQTETLDDLGEKLLIVPSGPIRGTNGHQFREAVDKFVEDGIVSIVMDFYEVDSLDSSGAGYLLHVHDRLDRKGGKLALANLSPGVQIVIDSIGLTTFFTVCATVEEAVEEISG